MLHVNIIMLFVDKNKTHVNIITVSKPMGVDKTNRID